MTLTHHDTLTPIHVNPAHVIYVRRSSQNTTKIALPIGIIEVQEMPYEILPQISTMKNDVQHSPNQNDVDKNVLCEATESGGFQCELQRNHVGNHWISNDTIRKHSR